MKGEIREILNKIKWTKPTEYKDYLIIFTHRGYPNDKKEIKFDKIVGVKSSYFLYKENESSEITHIPFHRILEIIDLKNDKILWKKRT
ncbi:MAG: DUF504 domain-containing protein [Candidatus Helarchaeota archaeon]